MGDRGEGGGPPSVEHPGTTHSPFRPQADRARPGARVDPREGTELPNVTPHPSRILAAAVHKQLLGETPKRSRLLLIVDMGTDLRWWELIAPPRRRIPEPRDHGRTDHRRGLEASRPIDERMIVKESRTTRWHDLTSTTAGQGWR